ncbi:hypothetical protein CHS0354_012964, partial [Potamilus streckersoni]
MDEPLTDCQPLGSWLLLSRPYILDMRPIAQLSANNLVKKEDMKKTVLLVGFVGLCLASPYLQVSENDTVPAVDDPLILRAAVLAVGADDDDIERGCKDAKTSVLHLQYHGYRNEGAKGKRYSLYLRITKAD